MKLSLLYSNFLLLNNHQLRNSITKTRKKMSLDQNPVNLEIKAPNKVDLSDYDLLQTLGAGKFLHSSLCPRFFPEKNKYSQTKRNSDVRAIGERGQLNSTL